MERSVAAHEATRTEPAGTPIGGRPPWSASPEDVAEFVRRVGKPYDPANDDYEDPGPFARDVRAGKNTAIYNAHSYHTKVPPQGIIPYLEHYTKPGDLVLDPFCGSGMTGVACLMTGRHCMLNDLSPAATHIAYNYVTPVDVEALKREFNRIKAEVAEEFEWLYGTTCDRCGRPATIHYTIWSDVFACRGCGQDIVLWDAAVVRERRGDGYEPMLSSLAPIAKGWRPITVEDARPKRGRGGASVAAEPGDVLDTFTCPGCGARARKTQLRLVRTEPVVTAYQCQTCRSGRVERATTDRERNRLKDIAERETPYEVPNLRFGPDREMWRDAHREHGIDSVRQFWTPRNLWALAAWWASSSIPSEARVKSALQFVLTSTFGRSATRYLLGRGGNSAIAGTLYVPSFIVENNFQLLLDRKWSDIVAALVELTAWWRASPSHMLLTVHAGQSMGVPDESIDYVFADPPFGSKIFYSDVSLLWEAWLGYLTNQEFEAVWNRSSRTAQTGKTLEDYKRLMLESFAEMHRVLKPGRWASVVFHNSDDRVWHAIREAAMEAGFSIANALAFDKQQRTFKGIKGEKGEENVTNFDIVLNLQKAGGRAGRQPSAGEPAVEEARRPQNGQIPPEIEDFVVQVIQDHLAGLPVVPPEQEPVGQGTPIREQRSTQFIHSMVMQRLMREDKPVTNVTYSAVGSLLTELFKQVDGRWYLPGDEVTSGRLDDTITDEASAIEWIRRIIRTEGPQVYGDLAPRFRIASVHDKLSKSLDELLAENFHFDERRNRWRLPTASELEANREVVQRARARRIRRFLEGQGEGPRDPNGLADWVEDAHRLRLYSEAQQLFSRIIRGDVPEERYRRLLRLSRVWAMHAAGAAPGARQSELRMPDRGTD